MSTIYHTATIDINDYEVEVEIDSSEVLESVDADELVDALIGQESYKDLADRCFNCDSMLQAIRNHEDSPGLAFDVISTNTDDFVDYLVGNRAPENNRELLTKIWEKTVGETPPTVEIPPAAAPVDEPLGEKVRQLLEAAPLRDVLNCMMLQLGSARVAMVTVALAVETNPE